MAELESLTVSLDDQFSQSANTAAASAGNLATGLDKVTTSSQTVDTAMRTRGQTVDSINKKIADQAALTDRLTTIEQKYQAAVAIKIASMQAEAASASEIAEAIRRLGVVRDEDVQKTTSSFQKLDQKFVATQQAAVQTAQSIADATRSSFSALDGLVGKYDAVYAATQRTASARQDIIGLLNSNSLSISQYDTLTAALGKVEQGYRGILSAAEAAAQAERNATAAQGQSIANTFAGVKTQNIVQDDADYRARAADIEAYGQALDHARAKIDPLFAAQQQYAAKLQEIDAALAVGAAEEDVATAARVRAKASYDNSVESIRLSDQLITNVGTSSRNLNTQMRLLGVQAIQTFSGLSTGQPVFTTLIQQGHQVADSLLATGTGFGSLASAAASAITPMRLLGVGVAAVGVAFYELTKAGETSLAMLASTQQALRGNHTDFEALGQTVVDVAKKVSQSSGLGLDQALQTAKTLSAGKYFSGTAADLERLTRDAIDVGAAMGTSAADGAKVLAQGLVDPTKTANELASTFSTTLNPELLRQIDLMQKAGDQNGAYITLLKALETAAGGTARNGLGPIAKAWQDLGNAFTGSTEGWKPFEQWLANSFATTLNAITSAINGVSGAWNALKSGLSTDQGVITMPSTSGRAATDGTVSASPTSSATKDAFVSQWMDAAKTAGSALGVSPSVLLSQWGLETGWGKSAYNNNVGNIKASDYYIGDAYVNPGDNQRYRSYDSAAQFAQDFISVMKNGRYSAALNTGSDATAYGKALQAGGYATDPNYATKLAATASSLGVSGNIASDTQAATDALKKYTDQSRALKDLELNKEWQAMDVQLRTLEQTTGTGTTEYKALQEQMEKNRKEYYLNVDAMTAAQRQSVSSLNSTTGLTTADQALSAALEARRQVSLTNRGAELSAAEAEQVRTNVLAAQNQEFGRVTSSIAIATASSVDLTAAYNKGNQAVINVTAEQAAYNQALKLYGLNIPTDKLQALVDSYKLQAEWAGRAQVAQSNLNSRDNLAYIQTETSTLGENENIRNRQLAVMQAEQEMHRKFGDVLPQEAQDYINLKGAISDATSAYQHQQAVTSELGNFFTNTFDTISTSITSAFANGTESALKFKDIAKSVASAVLSEFVKLAVVNPLKNFLFGSSNSTVTLSDVTGLLGGSTTSVGSSSSGLLGSIAGALGLAGGASAFSGGETTITAASGTSGSSGGSSPFDTATSLLGAASSADSAGLLGGGSGGLIAGLGSKVVTYITDALGNTTWASGLATASGNAGSSIAQLAAGLSDAVGASSATSIAVASAASTVAEAIPYIGAVISIGTSLMNGNYLQAGATAVGAAIGTVILPGIGTAIGATLGNLVGSLFGGHAKNSFQGTQVMVENGQVVSGQTASQVQSSDEAVQSINDFGTSLNTYMNAVGIKLTNLNSLLGVVGQGITGLTEYASVADPAIFSKLQFDRNESDTSNFGVAKGALSGMSFNSITDLNNELIKIAGFATAVDAIGIQLKAVGKDISNIQIASVSGANPDALGSVTNAQGSVVQYHNDLRTALNADLPTQTFADTTALDTEISKVNTFVNGTLPSLLTPIEKTTSSITEAVDNIDKTYSDAIAQSLQYGLDNTAVLRQAEAEAISIVRRTALMSLTQDYTSIVNRYFVAVNDNVYTQQQATLDALRATQANEIETFTKSWTDIFGDGVKSTAQFQAALQGLSNTLGAEFTAKVTATNAAIKAQYDSLWQSFQSNYMVRDYQAQGNNQAADLLSYDIKAEQERQTYIDQQTAFWGDQINGNQGYQDQLALIDKVHAEERLAIEQKYAAQSIDVSTSVADAAAKAAEQTALVQSYQSGYIVRDLQYQGRNKEADLLSYDIKAQQERQSFIDSFDSAYGKIAENSQDFWDEITEIDKVHAEERLAIERNYAAKSLAFLQSFQSNYVVRDLQAQGNNKDADLLSYDIKAAQERQTFIDSFDSTYGQIAESSQSFQDELALIDRVHAEERLAIEKKYATDSTTALQNALSQAQGNITTLFGNLKSYTHTLQTGADSPLSPTDQYALASSQFDAVSGAARAGDYNSATELQTYAESLISASRSVYGSGAQYSADVTRVLDAISGTAANSDALTLSAQQKIVQDQTAAIVDAQTQVVNAVNDLRNEVIALRREQMATTRAAALAA